MGPVKDIEQLAIEFPEVFEFLSRKQRGRKEPMRIASLAKNAKTSKERAYSVVRRLEALGVGAIMRGPTGVPTRFMWKYNPISVGRAGTVHTPLKMFKLVKHSPLPKIELSVDNRGSSDYATISMDGVSIRGPKKKVLEILSKI